MLIIAYPGYSNIDNHQTLIINSIGISGNKITKEKTILRELEFRLGDTINTMEFNIMLKKSEENLLKTSLFNYVKINYDTINNSKLNIKIELDERWYTWPELYLDHADRNLSAWLQSKDFSRIKYGVGITQYNFRGRREKLTARFISGYVKQINLAYNYIYLDKKRKHSLDLNLNYDSQNKLDYATYQNDLITLKYDSNLYKRTEYLIKYSFRPRLYETFSLFVNYFRHSIADTIGKLNTNYLGNGKTDANYLELGYLFEFNRCDASYYPLKGFYFSLLTCHSGIFSHIADKYQVEIALYRFLQLSKKIYFGSGIRTQLTNKKHIPYIFIKAFGYNQFLRGYDNYVIDGQDFVLFKNTLKYQFFSAKKIKFKYLPIRQFNKIHLSMYFNLFTDIGYVNDFIKNDIKNTLSDKWLYTFGAGIDLVTYYDITLNIYFAYNQYSKYGLFLHLNQLF